MFQQFIYLRSPVIFTSLLKWLLKYLKCSINTAISFTLTKIPFTWVDCVKKFYWCGYWTISCLYVLLTLPCASFPDILGCATRTHSEVWDKTPLLHGLVVGGLSPDQGQCERQARVVCAHHHGRHAGSWKSHTHIVVKLLFQMSIFFWLWLATPFKIKCIYIYTLTLHIVSVAHQL